MPPLLLFFIFLYLRFSGTLNNANYITLLLSGKKKLLYHVDVFFCFWDSCVWNAVFYKEHMDVVGISLDMELLCRECFYENKYDPIYLWVDYR